MKILLLSSPDPTKTSGMVAFDIYQGLKRIKGNEVKLIVRDWGKYDDSNIIPLETVSRARRKKLFLKVKYRLIRHKIIKIPAPKTDPDYHVLDVNQTASPFKTKKILRKAGFVPDAIIVLFIQNLLSLKNIYELGQITDAGIFMLLMDMAPFTAACGYAWDCMGYQQKCGNCPALYSRNRADQSHFNWEFKKKFIDKTAIHVIAATEWQIPQIRASSLLGGKPISKVLLPVDSRVFKPANKRALRATLGIPVQKKIIFFGSVELKHRRKGLHYLLESLKILDETIKGTALENNILLLIAGRGIDDILSRLHFRHHYMGFLHSPESMATAYQAADVFVCPSVEDAGPTMINQSIMCGTPVVSFEMGVAADLVHTGETGYRAKLADSVDLARGIHAILAMKTISYLDMSQNCRRLAMDSYDSAVTAEKIQQLISPYQK